MYNLKWIFSYQDIEYFQPPEDESQTIKVSSIPGDPLVPQVIFPCQLPLKEATTFLLLEVKLVTQLCPTLCDPTDYSAWNSPGQKTGVSSLSLLQGIFPTQELNQDLLHCRQILYQLSYEGSPSFFSLPFPFPSLSFFFLPYFNFTFPEFHTITNTFIQ